MDSNCPPPPSPRGGPSVCIVNDQDPLLQRFTMLLFFFFLRSCYHHCETKNLTHVECWGGGGLLECGKTSPTWSRGGGGGGRRGQMGVGDARAKGPRFFFFKGYPSRKIRVSSFVRSSFFLIRSNLRTDRLPLAGTFQGCEVLDAKLGAREPPHLGQRCKYRGLVTYQRTPSLPTPPARQTLCAALTYLLCSQRYFMSTAQVWLVRSLGRLQPSEPRAGGSGSITAVWISTLS